MKELTPGRHKISHEMRREMISFHLKLIVIHIIAYTPFWWIAFMSENQGTKEMFFYLCGIAMVLSLVITVIVPIIRLRK